MPTTTNLGIELLTEATPVTKNSLNKAFLKIDESLIANIIGHLTSKAHWQVWKAQTTYNLKDIIRTEDCPSWGFLECVGDGTTGTTVPVCPANEGDVVADNVAVWALRRIGSGSIEDLTAKKVTFSDFKSMLGAANVQEAIDKLKQLLDGLTAKDIAFADPSTPPIGDNVEKILLHLLNLAHNSNMLGSTELDESLKTDGHAIVYDAASGKYKLGKVLSETVNNWEVLQITKLNAVAPYTVDVTIPYTETFALPPIGVLKGGENTSGETEKIITACNFDNADADDFMIDGQSGELCPYFNWSGVLSIKTDYQILFNDKVVGSTQIYESDTVVQSNFKSTLSISLL